MQQDRRGIAVTTSSAVAIARLDAAVTSFLAHRRDTPDLVEAALNADPDLAVGHAFAGFLALLLARAELLPAARQALAQAKAALARRGGTVRERLLAEALACWCDGEMEQALRRMDEILLALPLDALTMKLAQSLAFMLGDAEGMRRSLDAILPAWSDAVPGYGFILGCHAFALEETGAFAEAEQTGKRALEHEAFDAWGCHAVAHVHEARRDTAQGLAWIAAHADRWRAVNNFARHLDWHQALFHLARNEVDAVLDLYDRKLRDVMTDDYRDITNAAGMLYRLEDRGIDVGRRWAELADLAERRIGDHSLAFAQLHYLLCLVGDGRWDAAYRLFAAMDLEARAGEGTQARLLGRLGVAMAKATLGSASIEGPAAGLFAAPRRDLAPLGGSRAQRQTFELILRAAERRERQSTKRLAMILSRAMRGARQPSRFSPRLGAVA